MDMSAHGIDPKLTDGKEGAAPKRGLDGLLAAAIMIAFLAGLLMLGIGLRLWIYLPQGTGQ